MKYLFPLFLILIACSPNKTQTIKDFTTLFEKSGGTETPTYWEVIQYYKDLATAYPNISIQEMGETDSGEPLHLVTLSADGNFDFDKVRTNKSIVLINNGIHPGESDGIDATAMLFRDYANGKLTLPKQVVLATIPVYNIGGCINRNETSRTNQNGPKAYGFRGNARNYDLNRDFIKNDTRNAKAFAVIFHLVKPDIFIDNHVSNGADYQYTLTHLFTQHNKLGGEIGKYLHDQMMPTLEKRLASKNWDITPYVNVFNRTPDAGFSQFMDYPRYSTGYTTLWNTLGMMVETHMLKPYKPRVEATYELMKQMVAIANEDFQKVKGLRKQSFESYKSGVKYPVTWELDTTQFSILNFKGYEGEYITSDVTGLKRLKYDKTKPFTREVKYNDYMKPVKEVVIPTAYIIPQGWHKVIDLLKINQVAFTRFEKDTIIQVESYKIAGYETRSRAYEGHYGHYNTTLKTEQTTLGFRKGDYYVPTNQLAVRYLIETLEPEATDSFFNWNFFDTILQQKEGFSPYVWEDKAAELLQKNPELKRKFDEKKAADANFAKSWYAQLDWLHKQSENYEKAHLQYPVYRVM